MEIYSVIRHNFFLWEAKFRRQKKLDERQIRWAVYRRIQEIKGNAIPVAAKKPQSSESHENIQRYVPVKFPLNIEILRIHEDYITATIFTLMLLNDLLVLLAPNVRNR